MKRARRVAGLLGAGVAAAMLAPGCIIKEVQVGDERPECEIDLDCEPRGTTAMACFDGVCMPKPVDPLWVCLDEPPLMPTNQVVDLRLEVVDAIARTPAVGALVRACNRLDPTCTSPFAPDTPVGPSGQVILGVPENFNGYFEVRSPVDEPDKFVPEILYLPAREIVRREGPVRRALLFREADARALAELVGGTFALGQTPNALALAVALNCQGNASPGISFELTTPDVASSQTVSFYTDRNNLPRLAATETSESGTFALTNLVDSAAAGTMALQATINPLQRTMGDGPVSLVRDNWMTLVYVAP
ncbi:MAG TPA: hypothetical protein VFS43_17820 [Polyangiaceae bacterium]|nr:hypothetical protein [Polyangiaceae bacterium]